VISSKIMALSDYDELKEELAVLDSAEEKIDAWHPSQHPHRRWEYAMALHCLPKGTGLRVTDYGCGNGMLGPVLHSLGHTVLLYDNWAMGDQKEYLRDKMQKASQLLQEGHLNYYEVRDRALGSLTDEDRNMDAVFCVSVLEHILSYETAFVDMLRSVRLGGVAFITTDFADSETDHFANAGLRAGKMFTTKTYADLVDIAKREGFELLDGAANYAWDEEENRLVADYGFASLALKRKIAQ